MPSHDRAPAGRPLASIAAPSEPAADPKLFEELCLPVLDPLYRFACRLEQDPERAADLLQQSLLAGFRHFRQLDEPGSFRAWMTQIVRRTFINRRSRRSAESPLADAELAAASDRLGSGGRLEPEERLMARRLGRELKAALDLLPCEQRLAVLLIDLQGFSYAEAATALQTAPGTVASRVARGRASLRRSLRHLAAEKGWR